MEPARPHHLPHLSSTWGSISLPASRDAVVPGVSPGRAWPGKRRLRGCRIAGPGRWPGFGGLLHHLCELAIDFLYQYSRWPAGTAPGERALAGSAVHVTDAF